VLAGIWPLVSVRNAEFMKDELRVSVPDSIIDLMAAAPGAPCRQAMKRGSRGMAMSAQQQQELDSFYALDNVVTVKITMPQAEWDAVRNEEPDGGRCNFEWTGGSRFTWHKAASVEILSDIALIVS